MQEFKRKARLHALSVMPQESVGLIVSGAYWPCKNIADNPIEDFVLDPYDYAKAMQSGTIEAVVHSHPRGTPPSELDRKACSQTKMPWYIYIVPNDSWLTLNP